MSRSRILLRWWKRSDKKKCEILNFRGKLTLTIIRSSPVFFSKLRLEIKICWIIHIKCDVIPPVLTRTLQGNFLAGLDHLPSQPLLFGTYLEYWAPTTTLSKSWNCYCYILMTTYLLIKQTMTWQGQCNNQLSPKEYTNWSVSGMTIDKLKNIYSESSAIN